MYKHEQVIGEGKGEGEGEDASVHHSHPGHSPCTVALLWLSSIWQLVGHLQSMFIVIITYARLSGLCPLPTLTTPPPHLPGLH